MKTDLDVDEKRHNILKDSSNFQQRYKGKIRNSQEIEITWVERRSLRPEIQMIISWRQKGSRILYLQTAEQNIERS